MASEEPEVLLYISLLVLGRTLEYVFDGKLTEKGAAWYDGMGT
jgi:hypothetical protein